ncbi:MAG: DUF4838 domain-containing protein [Lentisphaeria bacterium]|nr:DUF4838 domain-containing protein [Lentisphaeria bacterium]
MCKLLFTVTALLALPLFALDIVLPDNPHNYEKSAAEELLDALTQSRVPSVRITDSKSAKSPAIILKSTSQEGNRESWQLKTVNKDLHITGASPIGTLYGAYALLRKAGVYFIAWDETVYPDLSTWELPQLDESAAPVFSGRQIFSRYPNFFRDNQAKESDKKFWLYSLRNGFNGAIPAFSKKVLYLGDEMRWTTRAHFCHNYYEYLKPSEYFETHPEYFSMGKDGKRAANAHRRGTQLCLSNPAVVKIVADKMKEFIKLDRAELPRDRWPLIYNLTPNDAANEICFCSGCRKIVEEEGCETGLLIRFTNEIARQVHQEFPGIRILTRAAMGSETLPKTKPLPEVTVYYADDFTNASCFVPQSAERRENILRWAKAFDRTMVWDYWNMGLGAYFVPPRPEVVLDAMIDDVKFMGRNGIVNLFTEAERDFLIPQNFLDLEFFVLAQLLIDPEQDAEKLAGIFLAGYYGKAAPYLKKYLDNLRDGIKKHSKVQLCCAALRWEYLTDKFMLENYLLLQDALEAVKDEPRYQTRVMAETLALYYSILYYRSETEKTFAARGITMDKIQKDLAVYAEKVLEVWQMSPRKLAAQKKRLTQKLAPLCANLTVPEKFAGVAGVKVFAHPHQRRVAHSKARAVKDAKSLTGEAVMSDFHKSRKFTHRGVKNFSFYDYETKKGIQYTATPVDEEYHWHTIKNVRVSRNSIFTAHLWMIQIDLSQAWEFPHAGKPEVNDYDIHFRAKFTGKSFFSDSTRPDAVYVDCVVLVPKMKR